MIEAPLLQKALEHITNHPEEHDQDSWARRAPDCGTVLCLAGHVVQLAGHQIKWQEPDESGCEREQVGSRVVTPVVIDGATETRISKIAAYELGLTDGQAEQLFLRAERIEELWALAYAYTHGEVRIPEKIKAKVGN